MREYAVVRFTTSSSSLSILNAAAIATAALAVVNSEIALAAALSNNLTLSASDKEFWPIGQDDLLESICLDGFDVTGFGFCARQFPFVCNENW